MSEQNAQMDPATAQAVLFQDVYLPALAKEAAALGIPLPDEESLVAALESISILKQASQKQSSTLAKTAHAALCKATGRQTPEEKAAAEAQAKQAAEVAGADRIKQALSVLAKNKVQ